MMKFDISYDIDWESKVDKVVNTLSDIGYTSFFEKQTYGNDLKTIFIVLMCQDPELNLKQRIRRSKKEKILYMDIMLDLYAFKQMDPVERSKLVVHKILTEVPAVISKYKLPDFDLSKFERDLNKLFKKFK